MSGCGCKGQQSQQKSQGPTPKVITVNGITEVISEPTYTMEELKMVENWLVSTNKTQEETDFVLSFNLKHFGEQLTGYCDIPCQHRIRKRVEHLKEKLIKYGKH